MRILVVSDEPPFPARNGITIPASAYVRLLRERHTVEILLLEPQDRPFDPQHVAATCREARVVKVVRRRRLGHIQRAWDEVVRGVPAFHGWEYLGHPPDNCLAHDYDVVLATPISALDFGLRVRRRNQRLVAAINDCYTALLRTDPISRNSLRELVQGWGRRVRGVWMGRLESEVLLQCDKVLVQTSRDVDWADTIGGDALVRKIVSISNGADDALLSFHLPHDPPPPNVLFIASSFVPLYRDNLFRFHRDAWPAITRTIPEARLRVVGRGLELWPRLYETLRTDKSVDLIPFAPNLFDVYKGIRVAIAPIHKAYGFINKVAEAFACGAPVVGDQSAFNGMEGALQWGAGFAVNESFKYPGIVTRLLQDDVYWQRASAAARQFALKRLSWRSRLPQLIGAIEG